MALRGSSRRVWAVLLGAVYLAGLLAGPLHLILVKHVRCSEHRQLVHASEHQDEARPGPAQRVFVANVVHSDHDHCASCALTVDTRTADARTLPAAPALGGDGDTSDPTVIANVHVASARYLVAPKQSPPV